MAKQWRVAAPWTGCERAARALGISPLTAQLLFNRGLLTDQDRTALTREHRQAVRAFLKPDLKTLPDPDLLAGANEAARIVAEKVRLHKPIVIYGDYDVDGLAGTAILWHLLRLAGADVSYYIPHRLEEGYGLNSEALRQIHQSGADTVITVDCGITAIDQARLARRLGLTLIVTDHHAPGETLPDADAVVHPRLDARYPNPDLCGAGVAFKLAWAVARRLSGATRVDPRFREFLTDATGLTALGTIADVVPLTGENRVLAKFGLTGLAASRLPGLAALIEATRLENRALDSEHVGYWLAPRINAAGRMGHAQLAAQLLTEADQTRAREIALYLEEQNRKRQSLEKRIFKETCAQIEARGLASDARRGIVLASTDWHAGVIGIVASRLVERYRRPTILIALEGDTGQGSGRSIRPFDLQAALLACRDHLITCGGHAMAAGLQIAADRVDAFTEAFIEQANRKLTAQDLQDTLRLDAEVELAWLTDTFMREMNILAPFGPGNPKPRFASGMLPVEGEPRIIGRTGEHISFWLTDGRVRLRAIGFGLKDHLPRLSDHRRCRVAFQPAINTFNGRSSIELRVLDIAYPV